MKRRWLSFWFSLATGALVGCVHEPTVQLNHAELNGVQVAAFPPHLGIQLTIVVDIRNPNSFDVALRGMRGQAVISERYPLPIDLRPPPPGIWLRAGQSTQVRLPVDLPLELAVAVLREAFASPIIAYHVTGVADVTGSSTFKVDRNALPVDLRGTMTREQVAAVVPAVFLPH